MTRRRNFHSQFKLPEDHKNNFAKFLTNRSVHAKWLMMRITAEKGYSAAYCTS